MKLHVPKLHSIEDQETQIDFLKKYPFATLISNVDEELEISKVPLLLKQDGEKLYLEGHLARANPHWRTISNNSNITMMFD